MKKIFFSIAALFVAALTFAQVNPQAPLVRDSSILYGKLDNGLTYYIKHNDKPAGRAEFWFLSQVGAIQETPAQDGLAHFQEHMCLNGTKNLPDKMLINYFESIGAKFGANINASTGVEQTMYMLNGIPVAREGVIDTALLVMHDYSGFVTNDPAEIDKERGVIVEEWRTRRTADWRMHEQFLKVMYGGSKYANCTVIGTKENLETFPAEELQKFYNTWYRPDLQAIAVVGDVDPEQILAKMKVLFADIPARENPQPKDVIMIPENDQPIVGIITDPEAQITRIQCFIKSQPLPKEYKAYGMGYMVELVQDVIGDILNERLSDIARQANAPFIGAQMGVTQLTNTCDGFVLAAACKDGEAMKAYKALLTEFEKARRYGFTQAEYDRVKANMIAVAERNTSNAADRKNGEIVQSVINEFYSGRTAMTPAEREKQLKGYLQMLPLAALNQTMAQITLDKNFVVAYMAPEKEGLIHPTEKEFVDAIVEVKNSDIKANADDEVMEPLLSAAALVGSKVKKAAAGDFSSTVWTLKNGIRVIVRPSELKKEEVLFYLAAKGGKTLVSDENIASMDDNLIQLATNMAGLSKFPAGKLEKMLTGKMVNVSPFINDITHGVNGSCSPKDFETLLQLAYLTVVDARFNEEELAPVMAQLHAVVPNIENQPNFVLQQEMTKSFFGGNPRAELISSAKLAKMSISSLEKAYRELFANMAGAQVVICGNVNLDEIKPLVEKYIGSLPVGKKATNFIAANDPSILPGERTNKFEVAMATPKTTCLMAVTADMKADIENRIIMRMLNGILDMIYTDTVREDEGGTYGVGVQGTMQSQPRAMATLLVSFDTDPARADKLFDLAVAGLEGLAQNGPTQDQLNKAKGNLLKNIPESRMTNAYWQNVIISKNSTGVDIDTDVEKVIEGITVEKVQKFVTELLGQHNMVKLIMNPKQ